MGGTEAITSVSAGLFDIATDPGVQQQLERSRTRLVAVAPRRERRAEAIAAGLFVVAALVLLIGSGSPAPPLVAAVVLIAAYAAVLTVEFELGAGYTAPSVLVLVPMLYLLPPATVPLCVVAGHLVVYLVNVARGRRILTRVPVVLGQSWYSLGPALVFTLLTPGTAGWSDLPVVLAAFAAYVAYDATTSLGVDHLGHREALRPLLRTALWIYLVDLLLFPIGLVVTIAADGHLAPIAVLAPLCVLLALFAGERRHRLDGALELSRAYRGTAILLGDVVENDDHYTGAHSRAVVDLALAVGAQLGLDPRQTRRLEFGALLHDIGKIAVPKAILHKPGPLDPDEWAVMRRHTIDGQRMLESVGGVLAEVGAVVRSSHERWDGGGYPDGLVAGEVSIEARICAACDAFSAMTTDRPYRAAMSVEMAIAELRANAGSQFDPDVVEALVAVQAHDA
jgi:HD-GYP domain-containing protein (c-di-GMP phosphodiesterase class II)